MKYCVMTVKCVIVEADDKEDAEDNYDFLKSEYEFETVAKTFEVPEEQISEWRKETFNIADNLALTLSAMADEAEWYAFGKEYKAK